MTLADLKEELVNWKFSKYKLINFLIGISALLIYEFAGRPYYRPWVYANSINDFHIADTLGNSLGAIAAIFIPVALLTNGPTHGRPLIKLLVISIIIYEIAQPVFGKPIDLWDIAASILTGLLSYGLFSAIFKKEGV